MFTVKRSYAGLYKLSFVSLFVLSIHIYLKTATNYFLISSFFFVLGLLYYHIIMAVHELAHRTFVPNKSLNDILGCVLSPLVGLNFKQYREHHLKHHKAKNVSEDTDAYIYLPVVREKLWYKKLKAFILGSFSELFIKVKEKSLLMTNERFSARHSVIIAQLTLFMLFVVLSKPLNYFVFWLGPIIVISFLLNRTRVLIEHGYGFDSNLASNPQVTVNLNPSFLERVIFAPHNFNYHQDHHDFPWIPYYQLPEFNKLRTRDKADRIRNRSYLSMLRDILFRDVS